jgi:hypothetical protein
MNYKFDDDDDIRKAVIKKAEEEKKLEEIIKKELEELAHWYETETKILVEKQKILKNSNKELFDERKKKIMDLNEIYGANNIIKIKKKHNITGCY